MPSQINACSIPACDADGQWHQVQCVPPALPWGGIGIISLQN
ncbi:MAG: hypothetical protein KF693_01810 [Nitrospira sp.]|nr:hypothetical protein [Nitrospira sp.]